MGKPLVSSAKVYRLCNVPAVVQVLQKPFFDDLREALSRHENISCT
jgi:hypothetical protein